MKLGDTLFNGNQFKNVILNSTSYKRLILGVNLVWSYFSIAIKSFKTRISADGGTYEGESILEDRLQEITPSLFDSASLVITPNGVNTSKLYTIKPNDGTGDLTVLRNTSATRIDENGNIVDVSANVARIDYSNRSPAILVEPQRTNLVFPSDIATTQVRAVTAVAHTLSFYGTGSVTLSGAFSGSLVGTGANNRVSLTFTPTAGNLTLTVSGTVTNWQLEAGSNATSLIKSSSGSVTRNGDLISKAGIISLIGQTEGTIYVDFFLKNINAGLLAAIDTGNINNFITIEIKSNSRVWLNIRKDSTTPVTLISTSGVKLGNNKIVIFYKSDDYKIFLNGINIGTLNNPIFPSGTLSRMSLSDTSYGYFNNFYNTVALWKTQLTDQQAIQLTTL